MLSLALDAQGRDFLRSVTGKEILRRSGKKKEEKEEKKKTLRLDMRMFRKRRTSEKVCKQKGRNG